MSGEQKGQTGRQGTIGGKFGFVDIFTGVEVETEGAADAAIVVVVAAEAAEGEALEDVDSLLKQQELHWSYNFFSVLLDVRQLEHDHVPYGLIL